jgi:hypothetical protein
MFTQATFSFQNKTIHAATRINCRATTAVSTPAFISLPISFSKSVDISATAADFKSLNDFKKLIKRNDFSDFIKPF